MCVGRFISQGIFESMTKYYPKQQDCAAELMQIMEQFNVIPDDDFGRRLVKIFCYSKTFYKASYTNVSAFLKVSVSCVCCRSTLLCVREIRAYDVLDAEAPESRPAASALRTRHTLLARRGRAVPCGRGHCPLAHHSRSLHRDPPLARALQFTDLIDDLYWSTISLWVCWMLSSEIAPSLSQILI